MKLIPICQSLFVLLLTATSVSVSSDPYTLLQVEDGDTLVIEVSGKPTRVQLQGIDAPEDISNPKLVRDSERTGRNAELLLGLGQKATLHLQQLIGQATQIEVSGNLEITDKYGRIPITASLSGAEYSLNAAMVKEGYAIALSSNKSEIDVREDLPRLELQARREKAGLWQSDQELMQAWSGRPAATQ